MKLFQGQKLTNKNIIKSISYNQEEIIFNIMQLYNISEIDLDPTFSKGNFYKSIREPILKMDLYPQRYDVIPADCRSLPLKNESINSIMFDPPFLSTVRTVGIILNRFGRYNSIPELWYMYRDSIIEFYRILKENGILIFKCQDTNLSSTQWMSHVVVMNEAVRVGFYPKDLFILLSKNVLIAPHHQDQQHARKFHSYFWVFIKTNSKVNYNL